MRFEIAVVLSKLVRTVQKLCCSEIGATGSFKISRCPKIEIFSENTSNSQQFTLQLKCRGGHHTPSESTAPCPSRAFGQARNELSAETH